MPHKVIQNRNFSDLIANAQPEQIPMFDDATDQIKGYRLSSPSTLTVRLDDAVLTHDEQALLPLATRAALRREMNTTNSQATANAAKTNPFTWKHMILASGVLGRAGTSFDMSGNFEGTPFFSGFDSHFGTVWLGENAEIPEHTATTINFPYEIHTVGAFSLASRRIIKLAPQALPQVQIGQAIAIKNAVEQALIAGNKTKNPNAPDGLVKQVVDQSLMGTSKTGLVILSEAVEILEGNGLDKDALSVVMAPNVAKKFRQELASVAHPALSIPAPQMLVSKFMPSGTLIAGRYSDFQAVTGNEISFLAHTYTPQHVAETGATRIRSLFDVDAKVLNQESFVKVTGIA
ncbi:phage major capsid protein [Alkalimonas sp. MEB108]|uniref:Phage major capsid protein n=1 Tax=Alkalimonas cellulosilytica TaxID=3058395 RepID=A0ABU7J582_9GAMM|nr:phage major capsid protein [Alkalimonas sp. MEB108]MEE2001646.1 phage major capsid protein [Alkalimonas sp. MEB108]